MYKDLIDKKKKSLKLYLARKGSEVGMIQSYQMLHPSTSTKTVKANQLKNHFLFLLMSSYEKYLSDEITQQAITIYYQTLLSARQLSVLTVFTHTIHGCSRGPRLYATEISIQNKSRNRFMKMALEQNKTNRTNSYVFLCHITDHIFPRVVH